MNKIVKSLAIVCLLLSITTTLSAQRKITVLSPDGKTQAIINVGDKIQYTLMQDNKEVLSASEISMTLSDGTVWGGKSKLKSTKKYSENKTINTPNRKSTHITDSHNGVVLNFTDWKLEFRAFDDAVAYRFISEKTGKFEVKSEQADFNFPTDALATVPYVRSQGSFDKQFYNSFENTYTTTNLSKLDSKRLMFLPLSLEVQDGKRITITESDLRDYPGMYLNAKDKSNKLEGVFAGVRNEIQSPAGANKLLVIPKSRHDFIARVNGKRSFPWRVSIISRTDAELANSDAVYKLATENLIGDTSWIKVGKVAWDWWNNWNLEGVDFKTGVNNETYKYYIDFASNNSIEYVILDEGWAVAKASDLMQVVPEINLEELIDYGKQRGVGIILWAGYYAFDAKMETVCKHYSQMGVKGFKIDFMNGDCQDLVNFNERSAAMTAKYKLLLDIHGTYKPTGLERTYPNIINYEGVHGLEQMKWRPQSTDQVSYDVTMPFIRMVAGPVDYTQGAMRNAIRTTDKQTQKFENQYHPSYTTPMSQGTRTRQLAEYIVFFSPLNMLCDTPTAYEKNPESTAFIASTPTVWDESRVIEGKMGEYIITARRKADKWYIGGLTNWDSRTITLDIAKITGKSGKATLYRDGINADKNGTDFKIEQCIIESEKPFTVKMAGGGGFVLII